MKGALIYPHQLSIPPEFLAENRILYLIEDPLFFSYYRFTRQKLMLHRATMKRLEDELRRQGKTVRYVEFHELPDSSTIGDLLRREGIRDVLIADVTDNWLQRRVSRGLRESGIALRWLPTSLFITSGELIHAYRPKRSDFYFFNDFYLWQRRRTGILMQNGEPVSGRWSFDEDNRKKLPKKIQVPDSSYLEDSEFAREATSYVAHHFPDTYGRPGPLRYPDSHAQSLRLFERFLKERFALFGAYEDAISPEHSGLFHSLLTPALNIGLISAEQVLFQAIAQENVPINSREGFVRQIIGWREFVRLIYEQKGSYQRTCNALSHTKTLPSAFYTGHTGILPVDTVIARVLETGYCHHIERLMILGNFMLLCDLDPDQVYQWFMELFVDAYDWVMVPNVYGMSQYADGGLMTTKPYISGSSYILRMSSFSKGAWCHIWDALYWRFVDRHIELFRSNPRVGMMAVMRDKLEASGKLQDHLRTADGYLDQLFG